MERYWVYNLIVALAIGLYLFINEFLFYGHLWNL